MKKRYVIIMIVLMGSYSIADQLGDISSKADLLLNTYCKTKKGSKENLEVQKKLLFLDKELAKEIRTFFSKKEEGCSVVTPTNVIFRTYPTKLTKKVWVDFYKNDKKKVIYINYRRYKIGEAGFMYVCENSFWNTLKFKKRIKISAYTFFVGLKNNKVMFLPLKKQDQVFDKPDGESNSFLGMIRNKNGEIPYILFLKRFDGSGFFWKIEAYLYDSSNKRWGVARVDQSSGLGDFSYDEKKCLFKYTPIIYLKKGGKTAGEKTTTFLLKEIDKIPLKSWVFKKDLTEWGVL